LAKAYKKRISNEGIKTWLELTEVGKESNLMVSVDEMIDLNGNEEKIGAVL